MPGLSGNHMAGSETFSNTQSKIVDFTNTEIAFAHKSDKELKRMFWLFRLMNKSWLVNTGSSLGLWLHDKNINFINPLLKATIFEQFCGGTSLEDSQKAIHHLYENGTQTILDFGAEGKSKEEDFDRTLAENIKAISFAASHPSVPVISSKVTALASQELFEKVQAKEKLN